MTNVEDDRREFLRKATRSVGVGLCGLALASLVSACEIDSVNPADAPTSGENFDLDIASIPELQVVGGSIRQAFGSHNAGQEVLVIRTSESTFVVFSAVCTHQGTLVNRPEAGSNVAVCPRHGEEFLISDGAPQTDTAPRPLRQFPAQFNTSTSKLHIQF